MPVRMITMQNKPSFFFLLSLSLLILILEGCQKNIISSQDKPIVKVYHELTQEPIMSQPDHLDSSNLKLKIALAPFIYAVPSSSGRYTNDQDRFHVARQSLDILKGYLGQNKKFYLLEDETLNTLKNNFIPTDLAAYKFHYHYLVIGSVLSYDQQVTKNKQEFMTYVRVRMKVIDMASREMIYSEVGESHVKGKYQEGLETRYLDQAIHQAILALAPIVENFLQLKKPWYAEIIEGYTQGENQYLVIAAEKDQKLSKNMKLELFLRSQNFQNPLTNTQLTMVEKSLATIEVQEFLPGPPGKGKTLCKVLNYDLSSYIHSQNYDKLIVMQHSNKEVDAQ